MKRAMMVLLILFFVVWLSPPVFAQDKPTDKSSYDGPWEKFSLELGGFFPSINSSVQLGVKGSGVNIDPEDLLDLKTTTVVFRLDGSWRFTRNRRHRLDLSWYSFRRDGNTTIGQDITIGDIDIPAGTYVESFSNLDIYRLSYGYSFFQDDRIDLAALAGLYIMPIEFGINATGVVNKRVNENLTAPLPVFGLRADFAITPEWFLRSGTQIFYLEINQFKGSIFAAQVGVEYKPWKHVGIGLGFDTFNLNVEAEGEDYPGVDFQGQLQFHYRGSVACLLHVSKPTGIGGATGPGRLSHRNRYPRQTHRTAGSVCRRLWRDESFCLQERGFNGTDAHCDDHCSKAEIRRFFAPLLYGHNPELGGYS